MYVCYRSVSTGVFPNEKVVQTIFQRQVMSNKMRYSIPITQGFENEVLTSSLVRFSCLDSDGKTQRMAPIPIFQGKCAVGSTRSTGQRHQSRSQAYGRIDRRLAIPNSHIFLLELSLQACESWKVPLATTSGDRLYFVPYHVVSGVCLFNQDTNEYICAKVVNCQLCKFVVV